MGCNLWDQAGWILSAHFQSLQNSPVKQKSYHETVVDFMKAKPKSKWGVIPFRVKDSGKIEVLIISTRRKNWSFPKEI